MLNSITVNNKEQSWTAINLIKQKLDKAQWF